MGVISTQCNWLNVHVLQAVLEETKRPGAHCLVWLCQSLPKPDSGMCDGMWCWRSLSLVVCEGVPPRRAVLSLVASTFSLGLCFCVSVAVPLLSLCRSSLSAQPRGDKIQFINSINSINKQNATDQRISIAINTAIHVAKWSYFS